MCARTAVAKFCYGKPYVLYTVESVYRITSLVYELTLVNESFTSLVRFPVCSKRSYNNVRLMYAKDTVGIVSSYTGTLYLIVLPRIEVFKLMSVQYKRYATEHAHGVDGTVRDRAEPTVDSVYKLDCGLYSGGCCVRFFSSCACRPIGYSYTLVYCTLESARAERRGS